MPLIWRRPASRLSPLYQPFVLPLGQIVGRGVGHQGLPIVMLPHPIGEADESRIAQAVTLPRNASDC